MKIKIDNPETGAFLEYSPVTGAKGLVVICPGGGYEYISPRENEPVARAFAQAGWQGFVLSYSIENAPLGTTPLREISWAVRTAREEAARMGMRKTTLAVCGFSAGGHLAASLGVHWDDAEVFPDPDVRERHKPDALILCYPVITAGKYCHAVSIQQLAGEGAGVDYFSLEKHVDGKTPPTFLWHTAADKTVPVQNSLLFAQALIGSGVPVEMHIYPFGVHGLSLATEEVNEAAAGRVADPHVAGWFALCAQWLDCFFTK